MELPREQRAVDARTKRSQEWARLIRKLRWIGLEAEAERLELALSMLPPDERCSVSLGPFNTD
jgi:hypothetical protein